MLQEWKSNVPSTAETNRAYPRHLPPVTAMDFESRIQGSLKNVKILPQRSKYTMSVFKVASIILGTVMTSVFAANVIIVHDKEAFLKELIKKRDDLL